MISVEGDFVRTGWYELRRIRHKARKYRRYGGFKRNHLWLSKTLVAQASTTTETTRHNTSEGAAYTRAFSSLLSI